jgi:hypothetical protein
LQFPSLLWPFKLLLSCCLISTMSYLEIDGTFHINIHHI